MTSTRTELGEARSAHEDLEQQQRATRDELASLQTTLDDLRARLDASQQDLTRAQSAQAALQEELTAVQRARDEAQAESERELAHLRSMLPPDEGGSLDLEAVRAQAAQHAQELRDANRALRPGSSAQPQQLAAIEEAAEQLRRQQALTVRAQGGTLYQVRPGETLGVIAARFYGEGNTWPRVQEIYENNRHILESPDQVWPGTTLILP
ncbi:LysM peptidoglycan-binding domain-containing protein [Thioalkalivibrio paradoxus]|uniref:LysM peptidoglycan-binding domain-containing protein n=1 Tax=Thioalkalivibrio paradoxus TaxID=108010 RepID=UPI00022C4A5C|nr:LysM peptidoglycan-binding domain-containing protein [Thioalkalivibrio paradoxus]